MTKEITAHGITKLQVLSDPNQFGVRGLALTTEKGTSVYALDLETAAGLAEAVTEIMDALRKERQ